MALQTLWFVLWGLLWAVYFMLDGFDFGAGMLRVFLARDETDRAVTPHRHRPGLGRQRGVADHRRRRHLRRLSRHLRLHVQLPLSAHAPDPVLPHHPRSFHRVPGQGRERALALRPGTGSLALTSFTAPLVLGLGFGNIFQGLRFDARGYHGSFWQLFNPYGLLTAVLFVLLFLQHGALWLGYKTEGDLARRERDSGRSPVVPRARGCRRVPRAHGIRHAPVRQLPGPSRDGSRPRAGRCSAGRREGIPRAGAGRSPAFICSCATILLVIATGLVGLFPNLIPSRLDPAANLTISNCSSGHYTLRLMAIVALVFVPIVVVYQFLVYRFFRHKVAKGEASEGAEGY